MGLLDRIRQPQGIFDQDYDPEAILRHLGVGGAAAPGAGPAPPMRGAMPQVAPEGGGPGPVPEAAGAAPPPRPTLLRPGETVEPPPTGGGPMDAPPAVDDSRLRSLYGQLHPPVTKPSLKQRLVSTAIQAAPVAIGAIFGGGEGAGGAAKGENELHDTQFKQNFEKQGLLEKEYESEANRVEHQREQSTNAWINAPYRAAQVKYLEAGEGQRRSIEDLNDTKNAAGGFAPHAPPKEPAGDEFERGFEREHGGNKPTLKDRLDYDRQHAAAVHQPERPERPQRSLVVDAEGNVIEARPGMKLPKGSRPLSAGLNAAAQEDKSAAGQHTAIAYANDYLTNQHFTGPGDEALQEKFFEMAKPTSGFRMTQAQMQMLQHSRGWMSGLGARVRHATTGTWFSDEQRKQIVDTMNEIGKAAGHGVTGAGGPKAGDVEDGFRFKGGDPAQQSNWEKVKP